VTVVLVFLLFILALALFADAGLFALALTYHAAALWLAAFSFAVLPLGLGLGIWTELDAHRGRTEQEWARARAIWTEEEETDTDLDGDGVVGVPRTTFVTQGKDAPARTATPGEKARALLQWCYRRAAKNLHYGQQDRGTDWTRAEYDAGMAILQHVGLIAGRKQQGVKGQLAIVPLDGDWGKAALTALAVFDVNVTDV